MYSFFLTLFINATMLSSAHQILEQRHLSFRTTSAENRLTIIEQNSISFFLSFILKIILPLRVIWMLQ
jgi:hypothetical protein